MQSCYSCANTSCCPEHCCDWDHCLCKDCENCGGPPSAIVPKVQNIPPSPSPSSSKASTKSSTYSPSVFKGPNNEDLSIDEYIKMLAAESLRKQREEEATRQAIFDEKRRKEREEYEEIIASTKKCLERNREVLSSTSTTLSRLQSTMEGIRDTEKRFQEYKDAFGEVMRRALENAFGSGENVEELKQQFGVPKLSNVREVAQILKNCRNIAIITGAGVSAESGVFTYKDNEEKYDIAGAKLKLQEIMNINIYEYHPLEFWQNIQFNRKRFSSCKPNSVHKSLFDLIINYEKKGRKVSLITQNIDGFDKIRLNSNPNFFEIHGNTNEMRCKSVCSPAVLPCPETSEELVEVPKCQQCKSLMRPNVLLYGESYSEEYYRANSAAEACKAADALIIIGTQIKCGFPESRVKDFGKTGKPIVEINIDPVVEYGRVFVLNGRCSESFPLLVELLIKMK